MGRGNGKGQMGIHMREIGWMGRQMVRVYTFGSMGIDMLGNSSIS